MRLDADGRTPEVFSLKSQRGMSLITVALGMMAMLSATTLAIDVGMLMTARSQAQNAADAGALAGAVALAFNDMNNRSSSGPAVQSALEAARANLVAGTAVSVQSGDVTFPPDPAGTFDRVQVKVYRTAERGNALPTLMASLFGMTSTGIAATATAEAVPANSMSCVKPWAIPDRWIERQTPGWDSTDTFTAFPSNPSVFPDIFRNVTQTTYSGYTPAGAGTRITLGPEVGHAVEGDMYMALRLPGSNGEAQFLSNISGCESSRMSIGDLLTVESAATTADTIQGVNDLINLDPTAYWNSASNRVVSTHNPSPRIVAVPVYDPLQFDQGRRVNDFTRIRISNFIGVFIDHVEGNNVIAYLTPLAGQVSAGTPAPVGSFARATRLVQ